MSELFRIYDKPYGGGSVSSKTWIKIRKVISMIYDHKCANCGESHRLTVHHINLLKNDCRLSNLILLCQACHIKNETHHDAYNIYSEILRACANVDWGECEVSTCDFEGSNFTSIKNIDIISEEEAKKIGKKEIVYNNIIGFKKIGMNQMYKEETIERTSVPNVWIRRVRKGVFTFSITEEDFYNKVSQMLI